MENNNHYFFRVITDPNILKRDCQREYPKEVFPFGDDEIEMFTHEFEGIWHATEAKTGLIAGRGRTIFEAHQDAQKTIDKVGRKQFIANVEDVLKRLNDGQEYDYSKKAWSSSPSSADPAAASGAPPPARELRPFIQEVGDGADD